MKQFVLSFVILFSLSLQAQQVQNGSFENRLWDQPPHYPRPAGWENNNQNIRSADPDLPVQALAYGQSGNYSVIIWNALDTLSGVIQGGHLWQGLRLHGQIPVALHLYMNYDIAYHSKGSLSVDFYQSGAKLYSAVKLLTGNNFSGSFEEIWMPLAYPYELVPDSVCIHIRSSIVAPAENIYSSITVDDVELIYQPEQSIGDVFPNPVQSIHYITLRGFAQNTIQVQLLDVCGKKICSQKIYIADANETIQLDAGHLARGTYFYHFTSAQGNYTRKLVVAE